MQSEIVDRYTSGIDLPLAIHEIGHNLSYITRGADIVIVTEDEDNRGHFAQTVAFQTSPTPGPMPVDERTIVAGSVFSCLFADGLKDHITTDMLLQGGGLLALQICNTVGISPDDFEDAEKFDKGKLYVEGLRMALLGLAYPDLILALAKHLVARAEGGRPVAFSAAPILAMLGDYNDILQLADFPQMFVNQGSRDNILQTCAEKASANAGFNGQLLGRAVHNGQPPQTPPSLRSGA